MAQRLGTPALEFKGAGGEGWGTDCAAQPISVGTVHEISLLSDPFCTDFFFFFLSAPLWNQNQSVISQHLL